MQQSPSTDNLNDDNILNTYDSFIDEYDSDTDEINNKYFISRKTIELQRDILHAFDNMNKIIIHIKQSITP